MLNKLCAEVRLLQLPSAENVSLPLRAISNADIIHTGFLHDIAIELILTGSLVPDIQGNHGSGNF
jgi:hypothetical protein